MTADPIPLDALPIRVNPWLAGSKRTYIYDGVLNVSQGTFDQLKTAGPEELETLLKTIMVVDMSGFEQVGRLLARGPFDGAA